MLQLSSSGFGRFGKREAVSTAIYKLDCASTLSHNLLFRESCFLSPQRFHDFFARVSLRKTMLNCYLRLQYHSVHQRNRTLQTLAINTLPFRRCFVSMASEDSAELLLAIGLPFRAPAEQDLAGVGDQHAAVFTFRCFYYGRIAPSTSLVDTTLVCVTRCTAGACDAGQVFSFYCCWNPEGIALRTRKTRLICPTK